MPITLFLVALLGAVFLKGFKEAIGIAVALVSAYLTLNLIVVVIGLEHIAAHPHVFADWKTALFSAHGSPLAMIGASLLLFPKLALGLSGFETGVSMMPLIKGESEDQEPRPAGKIRNTHHLLFSAALIMSLFLLSTALITTLLIPADAFRTAGPNGEPSGPANGRALAYLAHQFLGDGFGTVYDVSTIAILWFAGGSAMASGDRLRVDTTFPGGRGRARWRVCDWSACSDDFCCGGGDPVGVAGASSSKECVLRPDHAGFCLRHFG